MLWRAHRDLGQNVHHVAPNSSVHTILGTAAEIGPTVSSESAAAASPAFQEMLRILLVLLVPGVPGEVGCVFGDR